MALPSSPAAESFTPDVVRAALLRLRAEKVEITPESFAWAYRQSLRERGIEPDLQYVTRLAPLEHGLAALRDLLVGDAWLTQRVASLGDVLENTALAEDARIERVRHEIDQILKGKPELLKELAIVIDELRRAIGEAVAGMKALADTLGERHNDFARHERLAAEVADVADARAIIDLLRTDARRLRERLVADHGELRAHVGTVQDAGRYLLGVSTELLDPQPAAAGTA